MKGDRRHAAPPGVDAGREAQFRLAQAEAAAGELDGVRVFDPRTVRRAVAEQSYLEFDLTLGLAGLTQAAAISRDALQRD